MTCLFSYRGSNSKIRRGFTFVELVILLVIFGFVIALLLPTIARMQATEDKVQCASNLRAIGVALNAYATDHSNYVAHGADFCMPQYKGDFAQAPFWGWMERLRYGGYVDHEPRKPSAGQNGLLGVHYPSMEKGIFKCPSVASATAGENDNAHDYTFSYAMNAEASPVTELKRPTSYHRTAQWVQWSYLKSGKILIAESSANEPVLFRPHTKGRTPHDGGANYLLADGSVVYSTEYHTAFNVGTPEQREMHNEHWDHGDLMVNY